jgi:hypothetical protein
MLYNAHLGLAVLYVTVLVFAAMLLSDGSYQRYPKYQLAAVALHANHCFVLLLQPYTLTRIQHSSCSSCRSCCYCSSRFCSWRYRL